MFDLSPIYLQSPNFQFITTNYIRCHALGDQTLEDVGSGLGIVSNPYQVDNVQKSVLKAPFASMAVAKPAHIMLPPAPLLKMIMGYVCGGWYGAFKALFFSK